MSVLETASCSVKGYRSGLELSAGRVKVWNKTAQSEFNISIEQISGITLKTGALTRGYLHLAVFNGTHPPVSTIKAMSDPYTVALAMGKADAAQEFLALVEDYLSRYPAASRKSTQRIDDRAAEPSAVLVAAEGSASGGGPAGQAMAPAGRGLENLGRKARRLYDEQIGDADVQFVIAGLSDQWLVALNDRCVIIKPGFMAGATGGGRVTTFQYSDVSGIEVNTGWMTGVLEVLTPSYQGVGQRDYWSGKKNENPHEVSNCLPLNKALLMQSASLIEALRRLVAAAKRPQREPSGGALGLGLGAQLRELSDLRDAGVLTETEFEQAKAKLLS